jgi:hypothetical protein
MPDYLVAIITALIGAGLGSIGTVLIRDRLQRKAEAQAAQARVLQLYLLQLQDAVECLWYRLFNIYRKGGKSAMDEGYYETSTLYALGRVLAYERILLLDGVYALLEETAPSLEWELRPSLRSLDRHLADDGLQRYTRLALAEAAMEQGQGHHRTREYTAFVQDYRDEQLVMHSLLEPARDHISGWKSKHPGLPTILESLDGIARSLADETEIQTSLPAKWTTA